jgi:hypothetical protein
LDHVDLAQLRVTPHLDLHLVPSLLEVSLHFVGVLLFLE